MAARHARPRACTRAPAAASRRANGSKVAPTLSEDGERSRDHEDDHPQVEALGVFDKRVKFGDGRAEFLDQFFSNLVPGCIASCAWALITAFCSLAPS